MPDEDDGIQCHALLVDYWAKLLWRGIFDRVDADGARSARTRFRGSRIHIADVGCRDERAPRGRLSQRRRRRCAPAGDGSISSEELRAIDEDGDGRVDKAELRHAMRRVGFDAHRDELTFIEAIMAAAGDADRDGVLTLNEINTRAAAEVAAHARRPGRDCS